MLYDYYDTVSVANFTPDSISDVKSPTCDDNCKTTITENYAYSPGVIIFTADQLQYNAPIKNVEGNIKLVVEEIFLLVRF